MATRNFYMKGRVDGRNTLLEGGPRSKDGGFEMQFLIRNEGSIEKLCKMQGYAIHRDGDLYLLRMQLVDHNGEVVYSQVRNR